MIKYISKKELMENNCYNMKKAMEIIEKTLIDYSNGNIMLPTKISQIFDKETQNRINCMPATLLKERVCGMKWVAVFPENPKKFGIPNVNGTILLSNIDNGLPIAIMDGTLITNLRTAAIGGVAAKYLAPKNSEVIGFIGAGEQAKNHLIAMKEVFPNIRMCKVSARDMESTNKFVETMKLKFDDIEFVNCTNNYEMAARNSDIIVTATSSQEQILQASWIKKGAYYCHVGGLEDSYNVPKIADKIVCDDWESVKHRTQTISLMYQRGELKDEDIYANLVEIVNGNKKGRENETEFTYFNSVGLAYIDVAIANEFYKKSVEEKFGSLLEM